MKKLISIAILLIFSLSTYAQQEVTKFLGIPVDGSKTQMIQKLKAKGFRYDSKLDALVGEFNGSQVNVFIATNNNKVCRIAVIDKNNVDERDIQIRFNKLCDQFANNPRYIAIEDNKIPNDENIGYEISVNDKRYQAIFCQKPIDDMENRPVWFMISDFYGEYYITMFYDNEYNRANGEDL